MGRKNIDIMAQIHVHVPDELKKQFKKLCIDKGTDMTTLIEVLITQWIRQQTR